MIAWGGACGTLGRHEQHTRRPERPRYRQTFSAAFQAFGFLGGFTQASARLGAGSGLGYLSAGPSGRSQCKNRSATKATEITERSAAQKGPIMTVRFVNVTLNSHISTGISGRNHDVSRSHKREVWKYARQHPDNRCFPRNRPIYCQLSQRFMQLESQ